MDVDANVNIDGRVLFKKDCVVSMNDCRFFKFERLRNLSYVSVGLVRMSLIIWVSFFYEWVSFFYECLKNNQLQSEK